MMFEGGVQLVLKLASPDGLAATAITQRIAYSTKARRRDSRQ
jgi:hypothetical protein